MIILFLTLIILSLFTYCLKICENMFCRHSGPDSGESSSEGGDNHCMRWKFAVSLHCCCCQWKVGRQLRIMPYNDTTSMYTSSSIYGDGYYHHHQPPPPSYIDIFPDSDPPGKYTLRTSQYYARKRYWVGWEKLEIFADVLYHLC